MRDGENIDGSDPPIEFRRHPDHDLEVVVRESFLEPPPKVLYHSTSWAAAQSILQRRTVASSYRACFSAARDKANQWNAYAEGGAGMCLGVAGLDEAAGNLRDISSTGVLFDA